MAPLVVKGKVLVGNSGGEFGVRGWLKALDAEDRRGRLERLQHRARRGRADRRRTSSRSTTTDQGKDLGVTTWPPDAWKSGGGTVWGWISYDPELNLIYYGTGNPGPVEPRASGPATTSGRPASSPAIPTPARRAGSTSGARTTSTTTTASTSRSCSTWSWNGQPRKVLVRPERNGYVYVLDRATGEVLSADAVRARSPRPPAST